MSLKRDKISIINDMLEIIREQNNKINPTKLMYKANLSHHMLTEYLKEIMTKGFVVEHVDKHGKKTYALTDKGFRFLQEYHVIKKFFDSYGLSSE